MKNDNPYRMESFEIYESETGCVVISQDCHGQDPNLIILHPDQIPILIDWLHEFYEILDSKGERLSDCSPASKQGDEKDA